MFSFKKNKNDNYEDTRSLPYEEKIARLSEFIGSFIAGWLESQASMIVEAEKARKNIDNDYAMMRNNMIMQANGGSFYTDEEIYTNLTTIALKRYDIEHCIKMNKYNIMQDIQNCDMGIGHCVTSHFSDASQINHEDIVNYIIAFNEEIEKITRNFAVIYARHNKPDNYDENDEEQAAAYEKEYLFVANYIYKYMHDRDVISKMVEIIFKTIDCGWESVKDVSELPFVDKNGQYIDDNGEIILEPGMFKRLAWARIYEDEILYKYLELGYDMRGRDMSIWKMMNDPVCNDKDFPYNMLVSKEEAGWRF